MSFGGAEVNKTDGGISQTTSSDRVIVLIAGMTLPAGMAYNTAYELLDISTAEDLGITASTDDLNNELTHYHLEEAFRLAPESTFTLIPVAKAQAVAALVADAALKSAIRGVKGVNVLMIEGLNTTVANALADAALLQTYVDSFATEKILIDGVFVEGVGAAVKIAVAAYPDRRTITAPNILHIIGQDPAIAGLKAAYALRAAVGSVMGMIAVRNIHEDLGSVDIETKPPKRRGQVNYMLTDTLLGRWLSCSLSDGTAFSTLSSAEQTSLTAKGWMYAGYFGDYPGVYFNGCPTAVSKGSDYAYFNFNCIWNKAARIIRKTLIPRVRSKVPKETDGSGYIKSTWIASAQEQVKTALQSMVSAGNIDDSEVYINPAQVVNETSPMNIKARVQVGDIVHEFDVDLGLTNKL